GTATEEKDAVDLAQLARVDIESSELGGGAVGGEAAAHGIFNGHRLLVDFLEHEVWEGAEFGILNVPTDGINDWRDGCFVDRGDVKLIGTEFDNLTVIQIYDILGAAGEGGDVGCQQVFVVADADNEGTAFAG